MRVRDLIRKKPAKLITAHPTDQLNSAIHLLIANNIGSLPVIEPDDAVVGFLAERDIVRAVHNRRKPLDSLLVKDVMRPAPTCDADDTVEDAMERMSTHRERHLIVRDEGKLAGILSVGDLVKHRLEQLETETGVLRDYVAAQRAAR